jgi:hypothetical protein
MELKYAFTRMIFQIEKLAGSIWDIGCPYKPNFVINRKEGIIPPEKYMGIIKKIFKYLRPVSFLYVSGKAASTDVISISTVVAPAYRTVFA